MNRRAIIYSADELAWIEARQAMPRRDLHVAFCAAWHRTDVSQQNLTALCKRSGWTTGRTGRFVKGQDAHNKGQTFTGAHHPNSIATRFKKGGRSGRANELYKPIGTERMSKSGYLERKVHDGMPLQSRWQAVHKIRWTEANGPIPEGHALKCLDGDRLNTEPDNWFAIPRALLPRLAGRWTLPYDSAPAELKPILLAMARVAHKARELKA